MSSSNSALLVSVVAASIYAYSAYYMSYNLDGGKKLKIAPEALEKYGQWKYLTFQTLLIQMATYLLHILAHFIKPLRGLRDLVFTSLAFPMASIVCYTFWGVWHVMGRELIFPSRLDLFFPSWLNHSIHTIIVPMNVILTFLIHHKHYKYGVLLTLVYSGAYTVFLHYIKAQTGYFVYEYLEKFDSTTRAAYFLGTALFTYLMYKSGEFLTFAVHGKGRPGEGVRSSAQKKKQR